MAFGLDFLGFDSKRRTALKGFDQALTALEVNPAYIDDGMRYLVYKWVEEEEAAQALPGPGLMDRRLQEAATLISYCVLGPTETEAVWGDTVRAERGRRFEAALANGHDEDFDVRLIKLVLTKGVAAPEISAAAILT